MIADATLDRLSTMAASPETLTYALQMSVEAIEMAPTRSSIANTIDSDALATEGPSSNSGGGGVVIAAAAGGAILLVLVLAVALWRWQRHKADQSPASGGDLKTIEISTTAGAASSTATDPERAGEVD